jgi:HK97 family phage major capsid protein
MSKAYLDRLTGQHEEIRVRIETLQGLSVTEERDLTEDELRSVTEDSAKAKVLEERITEAHEAETRAAAVSALAPIPPQVRATGNASATDRDPGHYRTMAEGGTNSFFGDMYRAQYLRNTESQTRLDEHSRALSVGAGSGNTQASGGIVPPKWLTDLYLPLSRQNRIAANLVTHLDLGNDPRPLVLPKQTAGTDAVVGATGEGQAVTSTDAFNTATETLTPAAISGEQVVTRQLVDSSTPGVDQLIAADLLAVYDAQIEALVCAAFVAAATADTAAFAHDTAGAVAAGWWNYAPAGSGPAGVNALIDAQTAVWQRRFKPATGIVVNPRRFGAIRKLVDLQGRPLLTPYSPQNNVGTNDQSVNGAAGELEGLPVYVTTGLGTTAYPESHIVGVLSDTILAESDLMQFRFEEVQGPGKIVLGVWRYAGVLVRQSGNGYSKVVVSAA